MRTESLGPVSAHLLEELDTRVREHSSVVWLDLDGHYREFVERLGAFERTGRYPVHGYRGSFLELMLSLEGAASGPDRPRLVVHLPGFNEDSVRQTPLLELYRAGVRYRKALPTLIAEAAGTRVEPERLEAFLARDDLTLQQADTWLRHQLASEEDGLRRQLDAMSLAALLDDLLGRGYVAAQCEGGEGREVVLSKLRASTGMPTSWVSLLGLDAASTPGDLAAGAAGWAFVVEFTSDLRRSPVQPELQPATKLPGPVVASCKGLAEHLRQRHPDFYERTADGIEGLLTDERRQATAEQLGEIDTFRFEEETILDGALAHLNARRWKDAHRLSETRFHNEDAKTSFWLRRDLGRRSTWQLLRAAAQLGLAIEAAGPLGAKSLVQAVEAYAKRGAAVDRAHRHLEQLRQRLLFPRLDRFESMKRSLDEMRVRWVEWADGWARSFNLLCAQEGFLPPPEYRQRNLFGEVVRPLVDEQGPTAYFMVDALRFEMATELLEQLKGLKSDRVRLDARLAELPTVTEVGMNVLALGGATDAPLRPALSDPDGGQILGFHTGEFRVSDPESRRRSIHDQVGGSRCPWLPLGVVLNEHAGALRKRIGGARLFVVHSEEIDKAGESGAGLQAFDTTLRQIRAAMHLLSEAGVQKFVVTSDHGFLLLEGVTKAQPRGRKIDPQRRHVFSRAAADEPGVARVPLQALHYSNVDAQLHMPETTAVFDRGKRSKNFVHGGNSLQERVIPVLSILHRTAAGGSSLRYALDVKRGRGLGEIHSLKVQVQVAMQSTGELAFSATPEVELAIRSPVGSEVEVEVVDIRGKAKLRGGSFVASVGESFEVFFRLRGDTQERVPVEVFHPTRAVDVEPVATEVRFDVEPSASAASAPAKAEKPSLEGAKTWLEALPEGDVRQVFIRLETHGTVTEPEIIQILGTGRAARKFARQFDTYAQVIPFRVRIESSAGVKRYIREGTQHP